MDVWKLEARLAEIKACRRAVAEDFEEQRSWKKKAPEVGVLHTVQALN